MGRSCTRYSPIRHSFLLQATRLPYDLHVLSLPLAFILSQDQTLHCIVVRIYLSFRSENRKSIYVIKLDHSLTHYQKFKFVIETRYLNLVSYLFSQSIKELFFKSECKYRNIISNPQNFFETIFQISFLTKIADCKTSLFSLNQTTCQTKIRLCLTLHGFYFK